MIAAEEECAVTSMFSTFCSIVLYLLVHFERSFRTFKTFHSLTKPITEANHQNLSPPHMSIPLCECLTGEVPGSQPSSNPSLSGLQEDGETKWCGQMINEEPRLPSSLGLPFICCSGLAWTRLMPTVNYLNKYFILLRRDQTIRVDRGCGKTQNRKKRKSLPTKPKTK